MPTAIDTIVTSLVISPTFIRASLFLCTTTHLSSSPNLLVDKRLLKCHEMPSVQREIGAGGDTDLAGALEQVSRGGSVAVAQRMCRQFASNAIPVGAKVSLIRRDCRIALVHHFAPFGAESWWFLAE